MKKSQLIATHRFLHNNQDIIFKFYSDHGIAIFDNHSGGYVLPADLSSEAYAFYALKRIQYIKKHILKSDKINNNEKVITA